MIFNVNMLFKRKNDAIKYVNEYDSMILEAKRKVKMENINS